VPPWAYRLAFKTVPGSIIECSPGGHLEAAHPGVIGGQGGVAVEGAGDADGIGLAVPLICKPVICSEATALGPPGAAAVIGESCLLAKASELLALGALTSIPPDEFARDGVVK